MNGASNKFPHYISDGSGRDNYVKNTEGGNSIPFRWRDQTDFYFKSTLRSHAEMPNVHYFSNFRKTHRIKTSLLNHN